MMKNNSQRKLRHFGLMVGMGFPVIIGWLIPAIFGHLFRVWSLWVGLPLMILGIIKPSFLAYPYKLWMLLGHGLGWINSRIILGMVFITVLQPIALIMRIFGYDPLRKKGVNGSSYREKKVNYKVDFNRIF